ncbi:MULTISPECIES: thymidylate synthase [Dyadobacter]|uniref:thymidylate synthase n=2 Tax=Dyadobacter TaxID=120831 RepID=A0A5R9KG96_9BACT|nr:MULTISPECIES: thymidylate synthase [Dyadobacter]KAA6436802.1 thymidylate synthase [Dyadobacter flavalbus]TLU95158.1 thymidylate synthase [Dyadobacter sediminis]GGC16374.1 thymidylate synthase [Dyadobacter sediminis]
MYLKHDNIDDLLREVYSELLKKEFDVFTTRSKTCEILGAVLCLENPRARLSRTESRGLPFSALGEFLWYMKGDNTLEFIEYFIPLYEKESEDGKIFGGYGPRIFNMRGINQIDNVANLLHSRPTSRRAVIQLFNAEDIHVIDRKEVPCTCTLQFFIRKDRLDMITHMRSNDAFKGLPHDIFAFTMLQEFLASRLTVGLGTYMHMVGSLHLYEVDADQATKYLSLGFQSRQNYMPSMPTSDNTKDISYLLDIEAKVRKRLPVSFEISNLSPYWADLGRLLCIYRLAKDGNVNEIATLRGAMDSKVYDTYIEKRLANLQKKSI